MKLKDYIDTSILEYATLFRFKNYEDSRLRVLDHIFLCYGTALEWHTDGFLAYHSHKGKFQIRKPKKIPENFFSDDLWEIDIKKEDLKEIKALLKGYKSYTIKREIGNRLCINILCNDKELVTKIFNKYRVKDAEEKHAEAYCKKHKIKWDRKPYLIKNEYLFEPYPMCEYSPIVEMINKQTNSYHVKNFKLKKIQKDYIEGAIEVIKKALEYYRDPEKIKTNMYHPAKALVGFKEEYNKDPEKFRKLRIEDGMLPEHTIEQWCTICWEKHLAEQVGYCEKLLEMYDK